MSDYIMEKLIDQDDRRTKMSAYCPNKVVEYNDDGLNLHPKYNTRDDCNTNSYETVSHNSNPYRTDHNGFSSSNDPNYIIEKVIIDQDDRRTVYSPNKIVKYSDDGLTSDPKYNASDDCNTNSYQTVSSTSHSTDQNDFSTSNYSNYIMEKLIESRNIILREQTMEEMRRQGVEVKQNFNFETYLCKVCDECFQTVESALEHTRGLEHFDLKSGKYVDELDRSLVIPTDRVTDISVVLARKQELKKLDLKTKYEFLRHGIRIKDGVGNDAYVCLKCRVAFMSFNYVRHHLSKFKEYPQQSEAEAVYSSNTFQGPVIKLRPPSARSSWRSERTIRPQAFRPQPSNSAQENNSRPLNKRKRRGEKRKTNTTSNPEPDGVKGETNNTLRRRRRRPRRRNRKRGSKERHEEKPKDLIKVE